MRRVLIAAAQVLVLAGLLLFAGGVAPVPGEPLEITWRQSTPAEERQYERDQLLDLLRAQQESAQK